jgi:hypothetical protein
MEDTKVRGSLQGAEARVCVDSYCNTRGGRTKGKDEAMEGDEQTKVKWTHTEKALGTLP